MIICFAPPGGIKQDPQLMCMLPQAARLEQQQQRDQDEQLQQQLEVPAGEVLLAVKPACLSEAACRTLLLAAGCGPERDTATPMLCSCALLGSPLWLLGRHVSKVCRAEHNQTS